MPLSERLRLDVWQRDEGTCQLCGGPGSEIHHKTHKMAGGRKGEWKKWIDRIENLELICLNCHRSLHG